MTTPYTCGQVVFDTVTATETVVLRSEFEKCPLKVVEIVTAGFSGTLDIQGKVWNGASYDNVSYSQLSQDGAQAVVNDQLSYTTNSARARYLVTEPYPMMQLVMARTAGSVSVIVHGWGIGISPTAVIKLAANSGVDIGDVDILSIAAGTNNIGDVDEAAIACAAGDVHAPAVNTAAIVTYAATASVKHVITGIAWSYDAAPTGGNLKVEDVSGTTVFTIDITDKGAGFFVFPKPKKSAAANTAMIITLAAAGAAVTGKVSCLNHWSES